MHASDERAEGQTSNRGRGRLPGIYIITTQKIHLESYLQSPAEANISPRFARRPTFVQPEAVRLPGENLGLNG